MKKRVWPILLCLVLSLGLTTPAALAAEQPVSPAPVIVVTPIRGGETLEVSVQTTAAAKAVHAVLSYDSSLLTPIQWDSRKTAIAIPQGDGWERSAAVHTLGYGGASGKPGLTYKTTDSDTAYLYLGAESMAEPLPGDTVVVTARFQYTAGADKAAAAASFTFAAETVAASSPANYVETVIDAQGKYYIVASAAPSEEYTLLTKGEVQLQSEGPSQLPEGGTVSGGYAITFFDWDGSVVDVAAVDKDATTQATAAQGKLSNKLGYKFDRWLLVEQQKSGLETKHGTLPANITALPQENQDLASFTDISGNLLVMAAYCTTAEVNNGQGADADLTNAKTYYTIGTPVYNQFTPATTSTGDYSITCTVERGSALRAKQPAVKAMVFMKSGEFITLRIDLENTDSTEFQLVVPRLVDKVYCTFVDTGGLTAWVSAGDRSGLSQSASAHIIREGAGTLIAQTAWEVANGKITGWDKVPAANGQALSDAGWTTAQRDKLVTLSEGREKAFTYQEAVTALKNG